MNDVNKLGSRPGVLLRMAADSSVQEDIGLSDDKKKEIGELYKEMKEAARNCDCDESNKDAEDRKAKFKKFLAKIEELDKKTKAVISDADFIRVRQIIWQEAGPFGLATLDGLICELKLSEEKVRDIKSIKGRFEKEGRKMLSSKDGNKFDFAAFSKKRKEAQDDIMHVLSEDEKNRYKQLLGKPFKRTAR